MHHARWKLAGLLSVVAALVAVATFEVSVAFRAGNELALARRQRDSLAAQIAIDQRRTSDASHRADEAARDREELAKAISAIRTQRLPASAGARFAATTPAIDRSSGGGALSPMSFGDALRAVPGGIGDEAERERLAHERAYQQDVARQQSHDARRIARVEADWAGLDAATKFTRRIETAEQMVAEGAFPLARRLLTTALAERPADVPPGSRVTALQAALEAQSSPVELTFASDDQTVVSVIGEKLLGRFVNAELKLPPGNFTVVGRRRGYQEVAMPLQLRQGVPAPTVVVICGQVAPP
jgi:hypothetical protein